MSKKISTTTPGYSRLPIILTFNSLPQFLAAIVEHGLPETEQPHAQNLEKAGVTFERNSNLYLLCIDPLHADKESIFEVLFHSFETNQYQFDREMFMQQNTVNLMHAQRARELFSYVNSLPLPSRGIDANEGGHSLQ